MPTIGVTQLATTPRMTDRVSVIYSSLQDKLGDSTESERTPDAPAPTVGGHFLPSLPNTAPRDTDPRHSAALPKSGDLRHRPR